MEAVGDNWPNAFSRPSESQSGSHKGSASSFPRGKTAGRGGDMGRVGVVVGGVGD